MKRWMLYLVACFAALFAGIVMVWAQPSDQLLRRLVIVASTPTASGGGFTFPDAYSNSRALFFNGDTNASGQAVDYSGYGRNAVNTGNVQSVAVGTNQNGRVQYAYQFSGVNFFGVQSNFVQGITSVAFVAWAQFTQAVSYAGLIYLNDTTNAMGLTCGTGNTVAAYVRATVVNKCNATALNEWHLYAGYWSAGQNLGAPRVYKDGEYNSIYVANTLTSEWNQPTVARFLLGRDDYSAARTVKGYISLAGMYTNAFPTTISFTTWLTNFYLYSHPTNNVIY